MADDDDDINEEGQNVDLQQLANESLAGKVYEPAKGRNARDSNHNNNSEQSANGANGSNNGKGKGQVKKQQQQKENKNIIYLQKYYSARDRLLAEAALIGGKPYYLISRAANPFHIEIANSIDLSETDMLRPPEVSGYINMPYRFDSEAHLRECIEKAKQEQLDSLYRKNISAADEIYSYLQEKIGLTHYLFFTGGNNSGKSNNLTKIHLTAYRNMMSTDMTAANIYQFLGSREDEGHGTICEDEADNIDESPDKMRIYKNGYTTGFPVLRTDTSFGRKQLKYNTFCFKAFAAERTPDPEKAKGFVQRIIEVNCFAGNPPCDISEIVNPAGDQENQKLLDELLEFRNILLIYKLLHFHEPIPDIKDLNIKNREKQLFKPLIRLFQKEECLGEILKVISEYISKKRAASVDSLQAYLYKTIKKMMATKNTMEFESSVIWQVIKDDLRGVEVKGKPMSYDTDDFGILSQKKIISILKDVFGAEPPRHTDNKKKLIFNKSKFDRLDSVYNLELEIKVGRGASGQKDSIGLDRHMISEVVEEEETANDSTKSESFTSESDEMDESDVSTAKTKDDAIISEDSSQTSIETREYSNNGISKNEKTMKENEEIAGHHPSKDGI